MKGIVMYKIINKGWSLFRKWFPSFLWIYSEENPPIVVPRCRPPISQPLPRDGFVVSTCSSKLYFCTFYSIQWSFQIDWRKRDRDSPRSGGGAWAPPGRGRRRTHRLVFRLGDWGWGPRWRRRGLRLGRRQTDVWRRRSWRSDDRPNRDGGCEAAAGRSGN